MGTSERVAVCNWLPPIVGSVEANFATAGAVVRFSTCAAPDQLHYVFITSTSVITQIQKRWIAAFSTVAIDLRSNVVDRGFSVRPDPYSCRIMALIQLTSQCLSFPANSFPARMFDPVATISAFRKSDHNSNGKMRVAVALTLLLAAGACVEAFKHAGKTCAFVTA